MMAQMTQAAFTIGGAFFAAVLLMCITGRKL